MKQNAASTAVLGVLALALTPLAIGQATSTTPPVTPAATPASTTAQETIALGDDPRDPNS
jgi:hypothetical protein